MPPDKKFLIIQTAFIGDVVLATALAEKLYTYYPDAQIDFLLRAGNEGLLTGHPFIRNVLIWRKEKYKYLNLLHLLSRIRREGYDRVINPHRFGASGFLTAFSGAKAKVGFEKNPFSPLFTERYPHIIGSESDSTYLHETARNQQLIADITDGAPAKPALYPSEQDFQNTAVHAKEPFITIAPASVWFTKQYPEERWVEFINQVKGYRIYLLGGAADIALCERIENTAGNKEVQSLAGKFSYLETCALMSSAAMNYTNDSAPMHFASAMNAPVTAVYCSTIPEFGFGPLSDVSHVVEVEEALYCRPCGLHGHRASPEGHFRCAYEIQTAQLLATLSRLEPAQRKKA